MLQSSELCDELNELLSLVLGVEEKSELLFLGFSETDETPLFKVEVQLKVGNSVESEGMADFQGIKKLCPFILI